MESQRLVDRVRSRMRLQHLSPRTEKAYLHWMRRFFAFHGGRHPRELGEPEIEAFLSALASGRSVAASTQGQALAALLFLYREVLGRELAHLDEIVRARRPRRLPVVLTRDEVAAVLAALSGTPRLMALVLYGGGLRLLECCRLRVKDVDLGAHELVVRQGKGDRDRRTILPQALAPALRQHLLAVRSQHERDLGRGAGWVELPGALGNKLPNAGREWPWQWIFPAARHYTDRVTGQRRRHHVHETVLQKCVRRAAVDAGLGKRVTTHAFRHSFATHLLEDGYDIRTVQELLGHRSVRTTMIYTHVLNRGYAAVRSPLDRLGVTGLAAGAVGSGRDAAPSAGGADPAASRPIAPHPVGLGGGARDDRHPPPRAPESAEDPAGPAAPPRFAGPPNAPKGAASTELASRTPGGPPALPTPENPPYRGPRPRDPREEPRHAREKDGRPEAGLAHVPGDQPSSDED